MWLNLIKDCGCVPGVRASTESSLMYILYGLVLYGNRAGTAKTMVTGALG